MEVNDQENVQKSTEHEEVVTEQVDFPPERLIKHLQRDNYDINV